jgi:hypothetical protein
MPLSNFQLNILALGGMDGGIKQSSGDGAKTGLTCHLLQITADTTFTTLTGVDEDGNDVNMVTANNLDESITAPAVICAPDLNNGGYIKAITISSGQILRHTMPGTLRG